MTAGSRAFNLNHLQVLYTFKEFDLLFNNQLVKLCQVFQTSLNIKKLTSIIIIYNIFKHVSYITVRNEKSASIKLFLIIPALFLCFVDKKTKRRTKRWYNNNMNKYLWGIHSNKAIILFILLYCKLSVCVKDKILTT